MSAFGGKADIREIDPKQTSAALRAQCSSTKLPCQRHSRGWRHRRQRPECQNAHLRAWRMVVLATHATCGCCWLCPSCRYISGSNDTRAPIPPPDSVITEFRKRLVSKGGQNDQVDCMTMRGRGGPLSDGAGFNSLSSSY